MDAMEDHSRQSGIGERDGSLTVRCNLWLGREEGGVAAWHQTNEVRRSVPLKMAFEQNGG